MPGDQTNEGAYEPEVTETLSIDDANEAFGAGAAEGSAPAEKSEEDTAAEAAAEEAIDDDTAAALELAKEAGLKESDLKGKTVDEITQAIEASKAPAKTDDAAAKRLADAEATAAAATKAAAEAKATEQAAAQAEAAKAAAAEASDPVKINAGLVASFLEKHGAEQIDEYDEQGNETQIPMSEWAERYPGQFKAMALMSQHIADARAASIVDDRTAPVQKIIEEQQYTSQKAQMYDTLAGDDYGHSDAAEIHASPEFLEYLDAASPGVQALHDSWDPKDQAAGLAIYKAQAGIVTTGSDAALESASKAAAKAGVDATDIEGKSVSQIKALTAAKVREKQAAAKKRADDIARNTARSRRGAMGTDPKTEPPDDSEAEDIFKKEASKEQ